MSYRTVLCLWLVLFLYPGGVLGQVYTDRKVRNFKVTEKTAVEVSNKYGKIHVIPWDKDSVRFEVELTISTSSYQKMEKMRSNIQFDFTANKSYVVAKTKFTNQAGIISDFVDAFIPSNQITINYMVYIPRDVSLKVENKFGDIYMDDFHGKLEIELSNGDLKANKLTGKPSIRLSSADGVINLFSNGKVFVSYSDLEIKESNNLSIESKSSRITLDKNTDIEIGSSRDKYEIGTVNKLKASGNFTNIKIESLQKELRSDLKYGNLEVKNISTQFSYININSEYTDIDLFFLQNTSYYLDMKHHKDVYISLPANLARLETKVLDEAEKLMLTYGRIGKTATETSPRVDISALKKCNINIIHR